jgi:hypothetical protein
MKIISTRLGNAGIEEHVLCSNSASNGHDYPYLEEGIDRISHCGGGDDYKTDYIKGRSYCYPYGLITTYGCLLTYTGARKVAVHQKNYKMMIAIDKAFKDFYVHQLVCLMNHVGASCDEIKRCATTDSEFTVAYGYHKWQYHIAFKSLRK